MTEVEVQLLSFDYTVDNHVLSSNFNRNRRAVVRPTVYPHRISLNKTIPEVGLTMCPFYVVRYSCDVTATDDGNARMLSGHSRRTTELCRVECPCALPFTSESRDYPQWTRKHEQLNPISEAEVIYGIFLLVEGVRTVWMGRVVNQIMDSTQLQWWHCIRGHSSLRSHIPHIDITVIIITMVTILSVTFIARLSTVKYRVFIIKCLLIFSVGNGAHELGYVCIRR
jgi:hypothetical protein